MASPVWPKTGASYELLGPIGKGATSIVYRAQCKENGLECAVKVFNMRELPDDSEERILKVPGSFCFAGFFGFHFFLLGKKEISTLSLLSHPNVVRLYTSFVKDDEELWMVMNLFSHGSVLDVMRDKFPNGLDEDAVGAILYSTLCALQLRD